MEPGLSTSWKAWRHSNGRALIFEIINAGFSAVELGFNLDAKMLADAIELASEGRISILSIHNYCPYPETFPRKEGLPDCVSLASLDEQERLRAIYYSKRSIENAARCKATALVLHCGRVQMPDATRELIALSAHAQDRSATEVLILQQRMRDSRKERADAHLQALMRSLDELVPVAEKSGIRLGVETRYYHREIPDFEETAILLARFSGNTLGYWHDTGHAFVQEKLGFAPREGYLREFGKYCIGMHIHDVRGYDDHYAPGTGEISFTPIAPYLAKGIIPVIEAHEPATIEQLQKAREHIRALMRAQ